MIKTEKDYKEFAKIGRRLGVPVFEAFLTLEVFDKNGKRTSYRRQRSHSWTRNAYNHMFCQLAAKQATDAGLFEAGKLSIKDIGASIRATNIIEIKDAACDSVDAGYRGVASTDTHGIVVGTGTGAESFEDYVLGTLIASGNGAGELAYGEQEAHDVSYVSGTKTLSTDLVRYFNNNSGGSITVNEIGLIAEMFIDGATSRYMMSARDKLGTGVEVADTGQLKVTYTISLVFAG